MGSMTVLLFGTVCAGMLFGLLIGHLSAAAQSSKKIQDAFDRGKAEAEVEKSNIGVEIGEELLKMREGIQQVARAYEGTLRVVHDRLTGSIEPGTLPIEDSSEAQLSLNFQDEYSTPAPRETAPDEEPLTIEKETVPAEVSAEEARDEVDFGSEGRRIKINGKEEPYSLQ